MFNIQKEYLNCICLLKNTCRLSFQKLSFEFEGHPPNVVPKFHFNFSFFINRILWLKVKFRSFADDICRYLQIWN